MNKSDAVFVAQVGGGILLAIALIELLSVIGFILAVLVAGGVGYHFLVAPLPHLLSSTLGKNIVRRDFHAVVDSGPKTDSAGLLIETLDFDTQLSQSDIDIAVHDLSPAGLVDLLSPLDINKGQLGKIVMLICSEYCPEQVRSGTHLREILKCGKGVANESYKWFKGLKDED